MEFSYQIFQGCKLTRRETRFLLSENPVPGIPVPYDPEPKLRIDNPKATTSDAIKVRDKCTIRNAGKGLFARKCIPKGSHITTYDGDLYLLSKADRESWLNTPVLRSHAKMLKGKSANACYVINGLKEYMPNRGLASLANDPANNFAFANSRLVYDDKKDILYLEALRTIEAGEEIFYRYDNHFPLVTDTAPSQRCQQPVRLNRSLISKEICSTNIKASIKTLTSSLNKKCIKTPEFRELRRHRHKHYHTEHKTPTKLRFERKWDKALTTYALIREKFIATSKITKSALNQLRKRSTIYKKLLEVYLQNLDKTTSDVNRALSNKKSIRFSRKKHSTLCNKEAILPLSIKEEINPDFLHTPPEETIKTLSDIENGCIPKITLRKIPQLITRKNHDIWAPTCKQVYASV